MPDKYQSALHARVHLGLLVFSCSRCIGYLNRLFGLCPLTCGVIACASALRSSLFQGTHLQQTQQELSASILAGKKNVLAIALILPI